MEPIIQSSFARFETKYLLTPRQYEAVRRAVRAHMQPDIYAEYPIHNIYYDTDDYTLIRLSLEKPVYKEKLRARSYGDVTDGSTVFAELKKKYKGEVYKRRIVLTAGEAADYLNRGVKPAQDNQIRREIDWFLMRNEVKPRVFIGYDREAYAGRDDPETRVTFDTRMRWRTDRLDLRLGGSGRPLIPGDEILMEAKLPGVAPLWLARVLSDAGAVRTSFSKYGTCYKSFILPEFKNIYESKEAYHCA